MNPILRGSTGRLGWVGGAASLFTLLISTPAAWSGPWGIDRGPAAYQRQPAGSIITDYPVGAFPVPQSQAYGYGDGGGYPTNRSPYPNGVGMGVNPPLSPVQIAQRCNIGRLVGGLLGGGVGYAASRQDGRSWAVPLGALLGQQIGCSVGAGGPPRPW